MHKEKKKLPPKITTVDLLIEYRAFTEVTNVKTEKGKLRLQDCVLEAVILRRPEG